MCSNRDKNVPNLTRADILRVRDSLDLRNDTARFWSIINRTNEKHNGFLDFIVNAGGAR
jgi:hypothetical protein